MRAWRLPAILAILAISAIMAAGPNQPVASAAPRAGGAQAPIHAFAFGVYWPWERTDGIAKNLGLDRWALVRRVCTLLAGSGVNTIWVVNIGAGDAKSLAAVAGPMHIKLVPCLGEIEPRDLGLDPNSPDFLSRALDFYRKTVPNIVASMGAERANILAWALCDEPAGPFLDLMEPLRGIFADADPDRPSIAVSTWGLTPDIIAKTRLTTFCVDLYPFFSAGNPNGPHTPDSSRSFLSTNTDRMVRAAGKDGRIGWLMPQCYNEIWGPYEWDSSGSLVALSGAFIHWRTPTPAEMRWQIWEGLRLGVKGIVFFCLLGPGDSNRDAKPVPDAALQSLIVHTPTPVGPPSLLDQLARPTAQFREAAALFRALGPRAQLLRRLQPDSGTWLTAEGGVVTGSFRDPKNSRIFVVAVNPDFEHAAQGSLTAAAGLHAVRDVLAGRNLKPSGDGKGFTISLPAGGGALLSVEH